jgi:hypothetical protein
MLVRSEGRLSVVQRPKPEAPASDCSPAQPMADVPTDRENKKPAVSTRAAEVREQINDMIRQNAPALTKAYNEALKKEAEKQALKKQPQKETISEEAEKKAT